MRARRKYSLGLDFGTNSVRALIVDVENGDEIATCVRDYRSGDKGILLDERDPNLARQNPSDYVRGVHDAVEGVIAEASQTDGFDVGAVIGIGVDTTASTPIPVDIENMPLSLKKEFAHNLAAQAYLWKDHTAHAEAAEITETARSTGEPYLAKCGGYYSSEWFWSKILHCERNNPDVFKAAYSWVELCDFIPAYLTGGSDPINIARSACAAGHKAMYNSMWGGLPSKSFLSKLSPGLASLRDRLYDKALPSDQIAGRLSIEIGLPRGIPVAVGTIDAHAGAVGAGVRPGRMVQVIGTSSCDMMVAPKTDNLPDIPGIAGIADDSIIPGMIGLEAGQAAVGDIYNWFVANLAPTGETHESLSSAAAKLRPGESGLLALDWNNGNRNVLGDPLLTGLIVGQTLRTNAFEMYRALVEATAFGAFTIIKRIEEYGVRIEEVVNCGGIAEKSPFVMQIYADVCNRPMKVSRSAQTSALGAAIFGAVVGGAYHTTEEAIDRMTGVQEKVYLPNKDNVQVYQRLYGHYLDLHDAFGKGTFSRSLYRVMKELIEIREAVKSGQQL